MHVAGTGFHIVRRVAVATISGAAGVMHRTDSPARDRGTATAQPPPVTETATDPDR
jgi:hypothetical protein